MAGKKSKSNRKYYYRTVHTRTSTKKVRCKMPDRPNKYKKKDITKKSWRKQTKSTRTKGAKEDLKKDRSLKAKRPGYRKSSTGSTYYEARKNRSDAKGKRI